MSKNNRKKVYTNRRKSSNSGAFGKLMLSIIILGIVILIFINVALPIVKEKAKEKIAEKTVDVITDNVDKIAGENPEVKEMMESLSEEDKETVAEIISEHMDTETVTEVMEYVNEGDKEGLINYAVENLSPEEISELMEIYGRYGE